MKKQKLRSWIILIVLFALSIVYSAQVFVNYSKQYVETAIANDVKDNNSESSEENVKETSSHLFLHDRPLYYLRPMNIIAVNVNTHVQNALPDVYLQLNTPPPDFA